MNCCVVSCAFCMPSCVVFDDLRSAVLHFATFSHILPGQNKAAPSRPAVFVTCVMPPGPFSPIQGGGHGSGRSSCCRPPSTPLKS